MTPKELQAALDAMEDRLREHMYLIAAIIAPLVIAGAGLDDDHRERVETKVRRRLSDLVDRRDPS